jgi:hypothetical protein
MDLAANARLAIEPVNLRVCLVADRGPAAGACATAL